MIAVEPGPSTITIVVGRPIPELVPRMNRLASETSLYLKQHAGNPVDWYPWGPEALAAAAALDRPIFLSVGYSACHWCHVMEHESFESDATALIMNAGFVCIKVDREERPDIDQIYMTAHHLLNRNEGGGWPLSVFLTPAGEPFYAGTYYPPDERYAPSRPSFPRLLHSVVAAWKNKRDELVELGKHVAEGLQNMGDLARSDTPLSADLLTSALKSLKRGFDGTNGGFGYAPKFPHPLECKLLLRLAQRDPANREALGMLTLTLDKMARGGMYDQIGGGFHRYSVDAVWLVPHFEKMLYDNALLPPVYTEAYLLTGDPFYKQVACETLDCILKELTSPEGGFYSTLDADSEGEEGKFYVWSEAEFDAILGPDDSRFAKGVWGVSASGNFEGHNIPCRARSDEEDAKRQKLDVPAFRTKLESVKAKLYEVRAKRVWPGRDEKILTAWNGLMIAAFAQAGAAFDEPKYTAAAVKAAEFVLTKMRTPDGRLLRTCGIGQPAKLTAYLEDYSYFIDALVSLYEATFDPRWILAANELADVLHARFDDPSGGFFYTADDHETLIARTKDLQDGSVPSGNAMAATALVRLSKLTGRTKDAAKAEETLRTYRSLMNDTPMGAGQMLVALDFWLGPVDEIAVIGACDSPAVREVLSLLRSQFRPNRVLAFHDPATGPAPAEVKLLEGKESLGDGTVYVCRDFACRAPLIGAEAVRATFVED